MTDRSQSNVFKFYRFVCQEKQKLISIRVNTITKPGDVSTYEGVDLYVTNQYDGLVAVGRDNYVWRSSNTVASRVDIHPTDIQVNTLS
jgi:hypothetical protein